MLIHGIDESMLVDNGQKVTVAIVDSGFSVVPSYATMHGVNHASGTTHGDRILSIFTALDGSHPVAGLRLHLACYNPSSGYEGLERALKMVPECDILSLSMLWRDDVGQLRQLLESRFGTVCVPSSSGSGMHFPASYGFTTTCSNVDDGTADYCVQPNADWHGNSYAVPAVARLLAYGRIVEGALNVQELFSPCRKPVVRSIGAGAGIMACPHCHRHIRSRRTNGFMKLERGTPCPYCGHAL